MKILIISQYWAPENGVPQRRWSWITEILNDAGHSVTVLAPPPHYDRQIEFREWWKNQSFRTKSESSNEEQSYSIIRTGFVPAGKSLTQRVLNQAAVAISALFAVSRRSGLLKESNPDLIIGTVPALPIAVVAFLASKRFKVPYIIDLRDAWPELIQESDRWNMSLGARSIRERILSKGPLQMLGLATTQAMNFALKHASGIIVTSSRLGAGLKEKHSKLPRPTQQVIALVRNVFPPEVSNEENKAQRSRSAHSLNVLYAGTIGRAQNLLNAIEAAEIANQRGYKVNLRLVGAGAAKSELVRVSKDRRAHIEISSKIAPEDLSGHYEWADSALVHLTDWAALQQAVPSKTYELMAISKHISAVVSGETADLISELEAGHVVRPESPSELAELWMKLIDKPSMLNISQKGAKWVQQQRAEIAPNEVLRIIESFER